MWLHGCLCRRQVVGRVVLIPPRARTLLFEAIDRPETVPTLTEDEWRKTFLLEDPKKYGKGEKLGLGVTSVLFCSYAEGRNRFVCTTILPFQKICQSFAFICY